MIVVFCIGIVGMVASAVMAYCMLSTEKSIKNIKRYNQECLDYYSKLIRTFN